MGRCTNARLFYCCLLYMWICEQIPSTGTELIDQLSVEVENCVRVASLPAVHRLRCSSGAGHVVWETILTSKINVVAANRLAVLTCCIVISK